MKILLIVFLIAEIILTCAIPAVKGLFFTMLGLFSSNIWLGLFLYVGILMAVDAVQNTKSLLITFVANAKRKALTLFYINKGIEEDTRAQRIQEDIKLYCINSFSVKCEYFISFSIVIWLIMQNYHYPLLIIGSMMYSGLCIGIAYLFKPKMIEAEKTIQQVETLFRSQIQEKKIFDLMNVLRTNINNSWVKFNYGLCVRIQTGIMILLPYLYLLPQYLQKSISLGGMIEMATIFDLLVINMAIIVNLWPTLMQSMASKQRLQELENVEKTSR